MRAYNNAIGRLQREGSLHSAPLVALMEVRMSYDLVNTFTKEHDEIGSLFINKIINHLKSDQKTLKGYRIEEDWNACIKEAIAVSFEGDVKLEITLTRPK